MTDLVGIYGKRSTLQKNSQTWYYTSMVKAFASGDDTITDLPAFNEFKKCVDGIFGDVTVYGMVCIVFPTLV